MTGWISKTPQSDTHTHWLKSPRMNKEGGRVDRKMLEIAEMRC